MTGINVGVDIPSGIDTLERLNAWSGLALANLYPNVGATEGAGYIERACQANVYYIAADNKYRMILRQSLLVTPDYLAGGQKMWMNIQQIGNIFLPEIFRTN